MKIVEQLEELSVKARKSGKLNKADGKVVEEQLALLLLEPNSMDKGFSMMLALPTTNVTKAFIDAWENASNEYKEDLIKRLITLKEWESTAGQNREIYLVKNFVEHANHVAIILLVHLSRLATGSGTKKPTAKLLDSFRRSLLDTNCLRQIKFMGHDLEAKDLGLIAFVVLLALSSKAEINEDDLSRIGIYIEWLGELDRKITIPPKLVQELEKNTKHFPENLQRRFLENGLIKTVTIPYKPEVLADENAEKHPSQLSKSPRIPVVQASASDFDPILYLEQIKDYIHYMKSYNQRLKRELDDIRKTYEIERQQRVRMEETVRFSEGKIKEIQIHYHEASQELHRQKSIAFDLNTQLEELRKSSYEKVTSLVDHMDEEVKQVVYEFKNELMESLRFLHSEFKELSSEEITVEVGEHLLYLLKQIFSVMGRKGISFH